MKKILLVDIDHTIADISHRLHYITGQHKDYAKFYGAVIDDKPIEDMIELVCELHKTWDIIYVTGRTDQCHEDTDTWIRNHVPLHGTFDLYMRGLSDRGPDHVIKMELLNALKEEYGPDTMFMALENRARTVKMYRDHGVRCLQVADGGFNTCPSYVSVSHSYEILLD